MIAAEASAARRPWRQAVTIAAAAEGVAVAVWLLPASVHIVSWPASGPVRVALVAPAARLMLPVAVALTVAAALVAWSWKGSAIDRIAAATAPLALLWAWVVPYAPWLPDRLPLLLVLAGPLRWAIAAAAIAGVVFRRVPVVDWTKTPR